MNEKIKKMFRHNQFLTVALVVCLSLGFYLVGCDSTVRSPVNPETKVSRVELDAERDHTLAKFKFAYEDLAKQDIFKQKLFEIGLVAAQGGTINPVGVGISLLGILGIGAIADNKRKDTVIKTLQNAGKQNETV